MFIHIKHTKVVTLNLMVPCVNKKLYQWCLEFELNYQSIQTTD